MKIKFTVYIVVAFAPLAFGQTPSRDLKVVDGFEIQKVAGTPLVDRPVVASIDDKGHLYVADSSGSNEKPEIQLQKKPHRIVRLTDSDGDGVYDKQTIFADQMSFLQGVLWKDGSLYVGAPPHIWKLTDTDNDGVADKREIWFDGQTLTGCANDLHGPYDGPDGYLYWTKGAFAKQPMTMEKSGPATRCAMIFRAKPDGSKREVVMTGGMDNPVDVVFLPNGERIFSTTFFQHPANGQRDGLVHAVIGAVYGKDHDPVYELPWTSTTLMPPMTHMGPAAPSGLHRYARDRLGKEYTGNLFCAQFNLRQVSRHIVEPFGSTFKTVDTPFVWSDDTDFHPTDVIEDRDGSLLVIDTGGWYKLCCPSSQLVKPDVLGGIYRVRKKDAPRTPVAAPAMPMSELYRVSLDRDAKGFDLAVKGLSDKDYQVRRLAAEALGRIGDKRAVPHLLTAMNDPANDRFLMHSLTYALMQIGDVDSIRIGLPTTNSLSKRQILMALHNLPNGIRPDDLKPILSVRGTDDDTLRKTAWWILRKHPELADQFVDFIRGRLGRSIDVFSKDAMAAYDEEGLFLAYVGVMTETPSIRRLIPELLNDPKLTSSQAADVFAIIRETRLKQIPDDWFDAITSFLNRGNHDSKQLMSAMFDLEDLKPGKDGYPRKYIDAIVRLASEDLEKTQYRYLALPSQTWTPSDAIFEARMNGLTQSNETRADLSLKLLEKFKLSESQLAQLTTKLPEAPQTKLPRLLGVFDRNRSSSVGLALVKALNTPEMQAKLRVEQIKPILDKYPEAVKTEAAKLYAAIDAARGDEKAKLLALLKDLPTGDVRRGQAIFNANKANCRACHTMGYVGGKTGPDLTRIGSIRTEADLVESIVYPSASFVRSYEPERFDLKDGRTFNGNVKSNDGTKIVLTIAADREEKFNVEDVEKRTPGTVSVMPSGFDQQLSKQELADLVAFLKASK